MGTEHRRTPSLFPISPYNVIYMKMSLLQDLPFGRSLNALALNFTPLLDNSLASNLQSKLFAGEGQLTSLYFPIFQEAWLKIKGKGNLRNRTSRRWSLRLERNLNLRRMPQTLHLNQEGSSFQLSFIHSTVYQQIKGTRPWRYKNFDFTFLV